MTSRGDIHVAFLRDLLARGATIAQARFSLQRDLPSLAPVYAFTIAQAEVRTFQEFTWSPELETFLLFENPPLNLPIDDQIDRFATIFLNNIEEAAAVYGKAFAHAVLVEVLRPEGLPSLDRVSMPPPSKTGVEYANCSLFLRHGRDGLINTIQHLGLPRHVAPSAMEIALDETFHISARDATFAGHPT